MGQFDYLIPKTGTTAPATNAPAAPVAPTPPAPSGGQFDYLIPKAAPVAPLPPPVIPLGGAVKSAEDFGSDIFGALTAPKPTTAGPFTVPNSTSAGDDIALGAINNFASTLKDTASRFGNAVSTVSDAHASALDKGISVGEAGVGALNALFSPVSAFLAGASQIPVVGRLAQGIGNVFGAIGKGGADVAESAVQSLPLSDDTKQKLQPLAQQIGALASQILIGKGGEDTFRAVSDKTSEFMNTVHDAVQGGKYVLNAPEMTKVPVAGESVETPVIPTNKYTPPEELPTIQVGPKAPPVLPTAETSPAEATGLPKNPELTYEPVSQETPGAPVSRETVSADPNAPAEAPIVPKPSTGTMKPVEGTGDTQVRSLSQGIEAKAIENGLTDTFGQLPEYKSVSMADQASKVSDLMDKNYEDAKQMALGTKAVPKGILPESVLVGVEKRAIAEGDSETLRQLATNGRLNYEATTMGQRIRTLAERDPSSPVGAIKAVQDARAEAIKGKKVDVESETAKTVKEIQESVKSSASTRPSWEQFVKSLTCNI